VAGSLRLNPVFTAFCCFVFGAEAMKVDVLSEAKSEGF
jgi:hypothetical protein